MRTGPMPSDQTVRSLQSYAPHYRQWSASWGWSGLHVLTILDDDGSPALIFC
jgi:hypothetical protein